jgi:glucosamine-6-phosphate deaminase
VPGGLDPARIHFPDAERAAEDPLGAARAFEDAIRAAGGIEVQLLGLGRNGHIAFNEPGSAYASRTRVVELDATTREDAAGAFGGVEQVPERAITVGVATILEARRLRAIALGEHKAPIVARTVDGAIGAEVPSTFLRRHPDATLHLDGAAASLLGTR